MLTLSLDQKTDSVAMRGVDRRCRMATHVYILVMIGAFPLFTGLDGYILLQEKKFYFFLICTLCWLLFLVVHVVRYFPKQEKNALRTHEALILLLIVAWVAAAALSPTGLVRSLDSMNHNGLTTYILYALIVLGISRFGKPRQIYLYVHSIAYSLCCVISLLQLLGFNPFWLYPGAMDYYDPYIIEMGRLLGTLGNLDIVSAYHCLSIPAFAAFMIFGTGRRRYILLFPVMLGLLCTVWAGIASGILALTLTAMAFLPFLAVKVHRALKGDDQMAERRCFLISVCSLISLGIFAIIVLYHVPVQNETLYELRSILHGNIRDEFGSGRIRIWRGCIEALRDELLFGIGPDRLLEYSEITFSRYSEVLDELIVARADDAHNMYLQLLLNFGVVGALPMLAVLIVLFSQIARSFRTSTATKTLSAGLLCYMLQAFFNISTCIIDPIPCILCGVIFSVPTNDPLEIQELG